MRAPRVVVVGRGSAGSSPLLVLAARGLAVTVLERRPARRQVRDDRVGGSADRRRADRLHHARGVRGDLRRGRRIARRPPRCSGPPRCWRGTPGATTSGSTCSPTSSARPMRSAARGRGRGAPLSRLLRARAAHLRRRSSGRSSVRATTSGDRWSPRRACAALAISGDQRRSSTLWRTLGDALPRSAPAPAVRALRDLLRLVALSRRLRR